jgi:ParB family chromosome partitioning protein
VEKRPALGKGLRALIPNLPTAPAATADAEIDRLEPNVYQPRGQVDDDRLEELTQSIRSNGVIQPIVVRAVGEKYQIIAGERRWRAAKRAGLQRVPIVVRNVEPGQDRSLLEMALIENIQRENLNPIDEGVAYRRLHEEFDLTQEQIATAVGKDRASVANMMRLLKLAPDVRADVAAGRLSMGHAKALLGIADEQAQADASREVQARNLSVRDTEALVKRLAEPRAAQPAGAAAAPPAAPPDVHTRAAEERLRLLFGTRVRIVRSGTKGRIEIDFVSEDELIRLFDALTDGHSPVV